MAGHSKWANIQHRKGKQDAIRGAQFTKLVREIHVAARTGGGDPAMNPRLRLAVEKATAASMPKDNIERAIKKATGELEGVNYEEARFEGYGPGGVAVFVDALPTTATAPWPKCAMPSASTGQPGHRRLGRLHVRMLGVLTFAPGTDEDAVMEVALEAGADDVVVYPEDGSLKC